ncbi:MAG: PQQ-binding-like beta-propeller repeat protein [Acidobacteria bacterium]|nr:PQQ-binding-like beta-propeller repeat protein [Acidobacteriota bacterium]
MNNFMMGASRYAALGLLMIGAYFLTLDFPSSGRLYAQSPSAMTTVQHNNARTGWNPNETLLNIDNVNPGSFGQKWTVTLDGQVYGAPLYVSDVMIAGQPRNVVFVATENNVIYGLDAETGEQLWMNISLGPPATRSQLQCGNISPYIGVTSTPVIDITTGTLYALGLTNSGPTYKIAAVDIATGSSRNGWPKIISPMPSEGIDSRVTSQRGALVLANGRVYAGFGGYYGDCGTYYGWVVGLDKDDPSATQVFYRTPGSGNHRGSGIWAPGGLAADEFGYIYPSTGNSFSAPLGRVDFSNAVIRLAPDLSFTEAEADYFMPADWRTLNTFDRDLGSSTPLLIPAQDGSSTPNMVFIMGKAGVGHLLNRDELGGVGREVFTDKPYSMSFAVAAYYQGEILGPVMFLAGRGSQPTCGISNGVAALALDVDTDGNSSYYVKYCVSTGTSLPPIITSAPGQVGMLWVVNTSGTLYAFNIDTGEELYRSTAGSTRSLLHFTVINGKVFIPTSSGSIVAYGLL